MLPYIIMDLPILSQPITFLPEKHETEVQEVHFSNTTILLRLCAMRYAHGRKDSRLFGDK